MFEKFRSAGGTNNECAMSSTAKSSQEEITWSFNRVRELRSQGLTKAQAVEQVKRERRDQPWIKK